MISRWVTDEAALKADGTQRNKNKRNNKIIKMKKKFKIKYFIKCCSFIILFGILTIWEWIYKIKFDYFIRIIIN